MNKETILVKNKVKMLITILLSIAGIIVPIVLYMAQLKEKKLTYELLSYSIINLSSELKDEFEIRFHGNKVDNLSAIHIGIRNTGDLPIRKEDFEREVVIDFGKEAQILKTSSDFKSPINLAPNLISNKNILRITPLLLNAGDYFFIEIIVTKASSDPTFDARIAGIKKPYKIERRLEPGGFIPDRLIKVIIFALMSLYSFMVGLLIKARKKPELLNFKPIAFMTLFSGLCTAYIIVGLKYFPSFSLSFSLFDVFLYFAATFFGIFIGIRLLKKEEKAKK